MARYEHAAPALFYFVENIIIPFFVHKNYLMIKWREKKGDQRSNTQEINGLTNEEK